MATDKHLGKLIGNTGNPASLSLALRGSFVARRGEFVRIPHTERDGEKETDCLGRIVTITRNNVLFSSELGEGVEDLNVLPGSRVSGETLYAKVELIGYKEEGTGEIRLPRRPLDPGAKVFGVDYQFLREFYQFSEETSIHIGNLVGYERGTDAVPIYIDVNTLATEHLAVLAMTGSGKSYTVGRIIERLVAQMNGTVIVFDPHGEYGRAYAGGKIQTNPDIEDVEDTRDKQMLPKIIQKLQSMQALGGGILAYTPQDSEFDNKYGGSNKRLALQFDNIDLDSISEILPGLTEPQARVVDVAIRKWIKDEPNRPRDVSNLLALLSNVDAIKDDQSLDLSDAEKKALGARSAAIAGIRLRRVLNEAKAFYTSGCNHPTNIQEIIGMRGKGAVGRLVIVDLQGLSDDARQIIVALMSTEILNAASSKTEPTRPCFIVYEEGHNFAPAAGASISRAIIKKIAAEGRKFGVGFAVISQRPSKLDPDVTSQCNTLITMRIKNPDDQRFIAKSTEQLSQADLDELPSLSTGEALISGRSIPAPLLVRVGYKALKHGGESPRILNEWAPGEL